MRLSRAGIMTGAAVVPNWHAPSDYSTAPNAMQTDPRTKHGACSRTMTSMQMAIHLSLQSTISVGDEHNTIFIDNIHRIFTGILLQCFQNRGTVIMPVSRYDTTVEIIPGQPNPANAVRGLALEFN
jgi:hypothetical protein